MALGIETVARLPGEPPHADALVEPEASRLTGIEYGARPSRPSYECRVRDGRTWRTSGRNALAPRLRLKARGSENAQERLPRTCSCRRRADPLQYQVDRRHF